MLLWVGSLVVVGAVTSQGDLGLWQPGHQALLSHWLSDHRSFRVARDADCSDDVVDAAGNTHTQTCAHLVEEIRKWAHNPNYEPFYATGDFNGDGHGDFAAVLIDTANAKPHRNAVVVVFNGPFTMNRGEQPAFILKDRSASATFLGYGPPRPKPWRLVIGSPEAEGYALVWQRGRYRVR